MNRVPEPALIRGVLVTITAVVAFVVGHSFDVAWIDVVVNVYAVVSALVASVLIRQKVTPVVDGGQHAA